MGEKNHPVGWGNEKARWLAWVFLQNGEKKSQLVGMLLQVWCSDRMSAKLKKRNFILELSPDGVCTEKSEFSDSSQEETDSRVILYCLYGKQQEYFYVRIKIPDTDIFLILLHYAEDLSDTTVLFDTGKGNQKRLIDINFPSKIEKGFTQPYCTALLALHSFTECDTTSAFKGQTKIRPMKLVQETSSFI